MVFGFGSCITHGKNMLLQSDQIKKKQDEFAVDVATHEVKKVSTRYGKSVSTRLQETKTTCSQ